MKQFKSKRSAVDGLAVILLCLSVSFGLAAQKQAISTDFHGQTIDVLLWDSVEYMCSQSPLSYFADYRNVFGRLTADTYISEAPVELDKNYQAKWLLRKGVLYLYDVEILDGAENYPDRFRIIEELTVRHKFVKYLGISSADQYPEGVMEAWWFTGFIYVKRQPGPHETYCDCRYLMEKPTLLFFTDGRLRYMDDSQTEMTYYIDNNEISKNPGKYEKLLKSGYKKAPCLELMEEKLSLDDDQVIHHTFQSFSTDEIRWNDSIFTVSESPLSFFEKYRDIYPNAVPEEGGFHSREKNYITRLAIAGERLYIQDIGFDLEKTACSDEKQENARIEYLNRVRPNRLQAVEELTGKKFRHVPALKQNAIPAEWYSGTLYFKRPPAQDDGLSPSFNYDCEPFYRITVEKGIVKSMEKTAYMVIKRNPAYGHN